MRQRRRAQTQAARPLRSAALERRKRSARPLPARRRGRIPSATTRRAARTPAPPHCAPAAIRRRLRRRRAPCPPRPVPRRTAPPHPRRAARRGTLPRAARPPRGTRRRGAEAEAARRKAARLRAHRPSSRPARFRTARSPAFRPKHPLKAHACKDSSFVSPRSRFQPMRARGVACAFSRRAAPETEKKTPRLAGFAAKRANMSLWPFQAYIAKRGKENALFARYGKRR